MLGRNLTTLELINITHIFSNNIGYKDLIREFDKQFNIKMDKANAKRLITNRSWHDVIKYLTGDDVDTKDLDVIPHIQQQHYELLTAMIKQNRQDEQERNADMDVFMNGNYFIPEECKYFNIPLYGQIITYKRKEPFIKCFLLKVETDGQRKINKIEDVPVSNELPAFLLNIIRKINNSSIITNDDTKIIQDNLHTYVSAVNVKDQQLTNIFDSALFKKYNIAMKA